MAHVRGSCSRLVTRGDPHSVFLESELSDDHYVGLVLVTMLVTDREKVSRVKTVRGLLRACACAGSMSGSFQ